MECDNKCKGTNQDGSPCKKVVQRGNGDYCWLHVEQAINQSTGPRSIKKTYKMPVDIKLDKLAEELEALALDVDYIQTKMERMEDVTIEETSEFAAKQLRIRDLRATKKELEAYKIENFQEENQFRVPVIQTNSSNIYAVRAISKGADVAATKTFQRAIDFQLRQLRSKERKLAREKDLRKKKSGDVPTENGAPPGE